MIVQCPKCGKRYRLEEEKLGEEGLAVRCTKCQEVFKVHPGASGERNTSPQEKGSVSEDPRVMICDDAPFFRTMLTDIFTAENFVVKAVGTGKDLLDGMESFKPDIIILDLQLPDMNGFEIVKTIRKGTIQPDIKILAMSAVYTDSSDVMDLQELGANDYIGKKFKPEHLLKRVNRLIGRKADPSGE